MRIRKNESGQVLVLAAIGLTALLGFLGLATDLGMMFRAKRNLQTVADAAATAGALDYLYNQSVSSAQAAGQAAATQNGVTNGTGGAVVTLNSPPLSGYHQSAGYVEAIVNQPNPTFFMKLFNINSITVTARAVAGTPGPSLDCVYVLQPTGSGTMTLQGSFAVSAPNCGIIVDSTDPDALQFTGAGGTLTAGSVSVAGGAGGHTGDSTPPPVTGAAPVSNPLSWITGPSVPGDCTITSTGTSVTGTVSNGGVLCYTNSVTLSNVTLNQGTYVFESGVTLGGRVLTGAGGATLDIVSGPLNINTGTTLGLVAPACSNASTADYCSGGGLNGLVLMEPPTNTNTLQFQKGNSCGSITGIIYMPSAQFYMQDSGGDQCGGLNLTTDMVVGQLFDKTSSLTIASYSAQNPTTSPLREVSLVE